MTCIYRPTAGPEDWRTFLADPDLHWKTGYSARAMANSWEDASGLPPEVREALAAHFGAEIEPLFVVPEHKVAMPGSASGPSQNDVFMFARIGEETAVVMVEGKVNESFDKTIGEWMIGASAAKQVRMEGLCSLLGLAHPPDPDLRYQLLHRAASAILEAERFGADHAVMLVQSFSQQHVWFDDFAGFVNALRGSAELGRLATVDVGKGHLHLGWVTGEPVFLTR